MAQEYYTTHCIYGEKTGIFKIYHKFQNLIDSGVISQSKPWMGNVVTALGKKPEDYPCCCDYLWMYIRDYDEEDFTRLYIDTYDYHTIHPELIELLIEAAGAAGEVQYAVMCEDAEDIYYFPNNDVNWLFKEPSDDDLMSVINSYWVEETPAEEVAEGLFTPEFIVGEDDFDAFLKRLA